MQPEVENLITIIHHLRVVVSQMHPAGKLTLGEFFVLNTVKSAIGRGECLTPTRLNEVLGTKKPATSRLLAALEKEKLIYRQQDRNDHRTWYLCLTNAGEDIFNREKDKYNMMMTKLKEQMGEHEIHQMEQLLQKLVVILESND